MKKSIFFFFWVILICCSFSTTYSQNLIALQHNGVSSLFTQLDSTVTQAVNGDTIYIPGGFFSLNVQINKSIHLVGVGHNPDSTQATQVSRILGNVTLTQGANNGSLTGLQIGGLNCQNSNDTISNYLVERCRLGGITLMPSSTNFSFIENVIQGVMSLGINPGVASDCFFSNNIIEGSCSGNYAFLTNSLFRNNIFLYQSYCSYGCWIPISSPNSTFENNIFISNNPSTSATYGTSSSIFNNNLFVENWTPSSCGCMGSNNIVNQPQSSIFINQTGNTFNYAHDYHLQTSSPGHNAGTDGTDVGIYGGTFPWKEGSIPFNPHILFKNIGYSTDPNGNLLINIHVEAQDH